MLRKTMIALALGAASPLTAAQPAPPPPAGLTIAGWDALVDRLRDLPPEMLAKLPASMRDDPQVQQEVGRLILASLAAHTLAAISGDVDHPVFLPYLNQTLNIGQPNADTVYRLAYISDAGIYRLRGRRSSMRLIKIAQTQPLAGDPGGNANNKFGASAADEDVNRLHTDAQGNFDVLLSATRPAGYSGDWWQLKPGTGRLLLRMVSSDWTKEREPTISIERVDKPVARPRIAVADLEMRLRKLPVATALMAQAFVDHVVALRQQGYVNKLKVFDISQMGGLSGQFYYEGAYELKDDEALIVSTKVPSGCAYRSLILTNEIYETTDWYNNQSSLNDSQASPDPDGILRIIVSAKDPGVPNWLDTAGYPRGAIQGRWTNCSAQPIPSVEKVAIGKVQQYLPSGTPTITPAEREQAIRARRMALQQRPLW